MPEAEFTLSLTAYDLYRNAFRTLHEISELQDKGDRNVRFKVIQIIWILNHLREWICPENDGLLAKGNRRKARTPEEHFFLSISRECSEFELIRQLANGTKHAHTEPKVKTGAFTGIYADFNFAEDSPQRLNLVANGKDLVREVIGPVLSFYKTRWFDLLPDESQDTDKMRQQ